MKNSKQQNNDLDLFSPIQEIFHEVCMMVACLFKELAIWGYRKLTNKNPPLEKINSEALKVKKTTKREDSLGIDTKTKQIYNLIELGKNGTKTTLTVSLFKVNQALAKTYFTFDKAKYPKYYINKAD